MLARPKVGMLLFLVTEVVFFAMLILAFIYYRNSPANTGGPTPYNALDVGRTAIFTASLLSSSLTIWLSVSAFKKGHERRGSFWLAATIVLGAVFLYGQGSEYLTLFGEQNVATGSDVFTSSFFALTGFHGAHVTGGLVLLCIALFLALRGAFAGGSRVVAIETISYFWHFVDAVWVVIFPTVYLWALLGR